MACAPESVRVRFYVLRRMHLTCFSEIDDDDDNMDRTGEQDESIPTIYPKYYHRSSPPRVLCDNNINSRSLHALHSPNMYYYDYTDKQLLYRCSAAISNTDESSSTPRPTTDNGRATVIDF